MNLQPSNDPWAKLVAVARNAPDDRDTSAPYGFSTRIAARAWSGQTRSVSLLERFALRAVGVACLLAMGSVALNYNSISVPPPTGEMVAIETVDLLPASDDAVAIVLDFSAD